jgi:hypothetical protein
MTSKNKTVQLVATAEKVELFDGDTVLEATPDGVENEAGPWKLVITKNREAHVTFKSSRATARLRLEMPPVGSIEKQSIQLESFKLAENSISVRCSASIWPVILITIAGFAIYVIATRFV